MPDSLLTYEPIIRLATFVGVLSAFAVLEAAFPRRARSVSRWIRWPNNFGVAVANTALIRVLFPAAAVGVALFADARGIGMLNWLALPDAVAAIVAIVALDLAIYAQHVAFHFVPILWRLHRMHHADLDFDATTGIRFHPGEALLSMIIKSAVILVIGAPVVAVVIFEVLLSATSIFNHTNLKLPESVDRVLRWAVVTPDMHRVHHSIEPQETNSNFGFNVPWWDYLFATYRAQPAAGHDAMTIGLPQFREPRELWLHRMLVQPFRGGIT